jgi:hypothetical protein
VKRVGSISLDPTSSHTPGIPKAKPLDEAARVVRAAGGGLTRAKK